MGRRCVTVWCILDPGAHRALQSGPHRGGGPIASRSKWGVWLTGGGVYIGPGLPERGAEFHDTGVRANDYEMAVEAARAFVSLKRKEAAIRQEMKAERVARKAEKTKQGVLPGAK